MRFLMRVYAIITFHSTHFAIKAKRVMEAHQRPFEMIAVPREFSAECGFCIKMDWEQGEDAVGLFLAQDVIFADKHRWEKPEESDQKELHFI